MLIVVQSAVELRESSEEDDLAEEVNRYLDKYPILKQALAAADCVRNSSVNRGTALRAAELVYLGQLLDQLDYRAQGFRPWSQVSFLSIVSLLTNPRRLDFAEIQVVKSLIPGEIQGQSLLVSEDQMRYQVVFQVGSGPDLEYRMLEVNGMSPEKDLCFPLKFVVTPMGWLGRDRSDDPVLYTGYAHSLQISAREWMHKAVKPTDWDQEMLRQWIADPGDNYDDD